MPRIYISATLKAFLYFHRCVCMLHERHTYSCFSLRFRTRFFYNYLRIYEKINPLIDSLCNHMDEVAINTVFKQAHRGAICPRNILLLPWKLHKTRKLWEEWNGERQWSKSEENNADILLLLVNCFALWSWCVWFCPAAQIAATELAYNDMWSKRARRPNWWHEMS
jgi:hypothetical protein